MRIFMLLAKFNDFTSICIRAYVNFTEQSLLGGIHLCIARDGMRDRLNLVKTIDFFFFKEKTLIHLNIPVRKILLSPRDLDLKALTSALRGSERKMDKIRRKDMIS